MATYMGYTIDESAFAMLLALEHCMESHSEALKRIKSKKGLETFYRSLLKLLLSDREARDMFLAYGGEVDVINVDAEGRVTGFEMF